MQSKGISFDFLGRDAGLGKALDHVSKKFDVAHSAADAFARSAGERVGTAVGRGIGGLIRNANKLGQASGGLRDMSSGLELIGISAGALGVAATATEAFSGAMDLASLAQEGFGAASKVAAAGQWLLNFALEANPIGLVIVAVAALAAAFVLLWKHSETFRRIVTAALRTVANVFLGVIGTLVNGAAKAFGWVPGIGPKLKAAAKAFDGFKDRVNNSLAGINETKTITIKAVSSTVAQADANAGIRSGAMSGSEAAASVVTRTRGLNVNVTNVVDKRGLTTGITQQTNKNVARGHLAPGLI